MKDFGLAELREIDPTLNDPEMEAEILGLMQDHPRVAEWLVGLQKRVADWYFYRNQGHAESTGVSQYPPSTTSAAVTQHGR